MSATELFPLLHALPHAEKLLALQYIVSDLVQEEGLETVPFPTVAEFYTPYDQYDAAATIGQIIAREEPENYE